MINTLLRYFFLYSGILLICINITGFFLSLRSAGITEKYADFARALTLSYEDAKTSLENLERSNLLKSEFVTEATKIFHFGIAHVSPEDINAKGLDYYHMRIPIWENYILYFLSYIKPDTYNDYEFCSYTKALERGTGRCGQQSLALISFLSSQQIDTGIIKLGGHTIVTAKVENGSWYLLDPDFGGVVPFGINIAEKSPASVIPYYWNSSIKDRKMYQLFDTKGNIVRYGGTDVRFARACLIERISYILKWIIPILMILIWAILLQYSRNPKATPKVN
jgi:hypothetical protein